MTDPLPLPTAQNGWVSTPERCPTDVLEQAKRIINSTIYCSLSTCSPDGFPWVSPVFFCHQDLSIYWASAVTSRHSQNLYQNQGRAAIAIYDSTVKHGSAEGLYFSGIASELPQEQVSEIMLLLFQRAGGDPPDRTEVDYLDKSPRRIYGFQPQEAWIRGNSLPIGKQLVDTKISLSLAELASAVYAKSTV